MDILIVLVVIQIILLVIQLGVWTSVSRCNYYLSQMMKIYNMREAEKERIRAGSS